ncbi:carboxypeptidase-like regulatory domain-containing protein [Mangrovimonas cancribranchiae]|uniref:Carboxypeptidase-like regulatory domain-containing protein n=1 Tax=Mangrovimonas cancribranchiae TaxID=3080055 RepID=A0AAU6NXG5_9FLAO
MNTITNNSCFSDLMKPTTQTMSKEVAKDTVAEIPQEMLKVPDVKGRVIDEFGDPVPNANVYLQSNNSIGVSTDANGEFLIEWVQAGEVIIVSHLTFKNVSFIHKDSNYKEIVLQVETQQLDEVTLTNKKFAWGWVLAAITAGTLIYNANKSSKKKAAKNSLNAAAPKKQKKQPIKVTI